MFVSSWFRVCLATPLLTLGLVGCPLYDSRSCLDNRHECPRGTECDARSGWCVLRERAPRYQERCNSPGDCTLGHSCSAEGRCVAGSCVIAGCVTGYRCVSNDGEQVCVPDEEQTSSDAGADAALHPDASQEAGPAR